jgi:hypothetical protein
MALPDRARVWLLLATLGTALYGSPASAVTAEDDAVPWQVWVIKQSTLCTLAIREAERRHQLPSGLLEAIAKAESGRPVTTMSDVRAWPWTIDADGEGLFLDSRAAAVAWVGQQRQHHKYIDVGCLQVDLTLHPGAFTSLDEAFDPMANANYAAHYLSDLYHSEARRDWNVAVGLYHSHTARLAAAYRDQVAVIGERILRGVLEPVPLYVRAIRRGTLRVPLSNGRSTPINVNRQPAVVSRRKLSACEIAGILGPYLGGRGGANRCIHAARLPDRDLREPARGTAGGDTP